MVEMDGQFQEDQGDLVVEVDHSFRLLEALEEVEVQYLVGLEVEEASFLLLVLVEVVDPCLPEDLGVVVNSCRLEDLVEEVSLKILA